MIRFWDSLFTLIRRNPLTVLRSSVLLTKGRAGFKAEIARHVILNPATLPYNKPLLDHLRAEYAAGREIYLATAANELQATKIADHLGIFTGVFASGVDLNLRDEAKREALDRKFAQQGFDYVGNSQADVPVLAGAKNAMLANPTVGLRAELKRKNIAIHQVFKDQAPFLKTLVKAIRVKQWPKNLLIFLPLLMAHLLFHEHRFFLTCMAFASWSLAASATYILNDLLDMEADRSHPTKRRRAFAAGDLSPQSGIVVVCVLLMLAAMIAARLPVSFDFWLAAYFLTTLAYSLVLKKIALIDVVTLAGLYTVRMVGGAYAIGAAFSPWLGAFSVFFFLSLAIVKRYAELDNLRKRDKCRRAAEDIEWKTLSSCAASERPAGTLPLLFLHFISITPQFWICTDTFSVFGCLSPY